MGIAGFATSEIAGVFALANGVNTWITELGSIMYQVHLLVKSRASYTFFVFMYTLSRVYFAYWSISVLTQAWTALHDPEWGVRYPIWAPFCAGSLQVSLLGINSIFALKHLKKLGKQYAGRRKGQRTQISSVPSSSVARSVHNQMQAKTSPSFCCETSLQCNWLVSQRLHHLVAAYVLSAIHSAPWEGAVSWTSVRAWSRESIYGFVLAPKIFLVVWNATSSAHRSLEAP